MTHGSLTLAVDKTTHIKNPSLTLYFDDPLNDVDLIVPKTEFNKEPFKCGIFYN